MSRLLKTAVLILIVLIGSWILYHRQQISGPGDILELAREDSSALNVPVLQASSPLVFRSDAFYHKHPDTIRIASFKLNSESGAAQKPDATRLLTEICRQFDLVALQDVNSRNPEWLANLTLSLKTATGFDYKFVASPFANGTQFVTLFNSKAVELDQSHSYAVNDPDDLYDREPFVCWFRTNQVEEKQAFTFSLASIQVDHNRRESELKHLGDLYRAIREDGRGEDDVIFVGDFQCGVNCLSSLESQSGLQSVLANSPTNTMRTAQFDNIIISPIATVECSGIAGVFDFMKHFNLYLDDALRISEHLPVWADFSIYEGLSPGRTASGETTERR